MAKAGYEETCSSLPACPSTSLQASDFEGPVLQSGQLSASCLQQPGWSLAERPPVPYTHTRTVLQAMMLPGGSRLRENEELTSAAGHKEVSCLTPLV